jgi:hypothetical protein
MRADILRCEHYGSGHSSRLYDSLDYATGEVFEIARCEEYSLDNLRTVLALPLPISAGTALEIAASVVGKGGVTQPVGIICDSIAP